MLALTAAISTKDRLGPLQALLESLRRQTLRPEELVIVDAASDPRVRAIATRQETFFGRVRYFPLPSSLTQARNHAVRNSDGQVVVFLDDDLILEPDFLREILRPFERDPERRIAGVTGDVIGHPRGRERWRQAFKRLFLLPCDGDGRFRLSGHPAVPHGLPEEREVEFLPGGLTAWRREVFADFAFDESLPGLAINEDVDFSYRVSRKWRNWYTPKARARHERPSLARESEGRYLAEELRSALYLYRKNLPKDPVHSLAFAWSLVGLLVRFAFRRWGRP